MYSHFTHQLCVHRIWSGRFNTSWMILVHVDICKYQISTPPLAGCSVVLEKFINILHVVSVKPYIPLQNRKLCILNQWEEILLHYVMSFIILNTMTTWNQIIYIIYTQTSYVSQPSEISCRTKRKVRKDKKVNRSAFQSCVKRMQQDVYGINCDGKLLVINNTAIDLQF